MGNKILDRRELFKRYEIEKQMAHKLLNATREERRILYGKIYDELFSRFSSHPQTELDAGEQSMSVWRQMRLLGGVCKSNSVFLEVGCGDCGLAVEIAKFVKKVYAVDVSKVITANKDLPKNCELNISDGIDIPVPLNSIDVAYSSQVVEHLHPDDVFTHLSNIYKALKPKGIYLCLTPNRLNGAHDISKYFTEVASALHLKEYTHQELATLFQKTGFTTVYTYVGGKGIYVRFPLALINVCEKILETITPSLRRKVANLLLFQSLLAIRIVGRKS